MSGPPLPTRPFHPYPYPLKKQIATLVVSVSKRPNDRANPRTPNEKKKQRADYLASAEGGGRKEVVAWVSLVSAMAVVMQKKPSPSSPLITALHAL